jgi:hypothetical protein
VQVTFDPERFDQPTLKVEHSEEVDRLELLAHGVESNVDLDPRISSVAAYIIIEANNFRGEGVEERLMDEPIPFAGRDYDSLIDFLSNYPLHQDRQHPKAEARRMLARQCWQEWGPIMVTQKEREAA